MFHLAMMSLSRPRDAIAEVLKIQIAHSDLIKGALFVACFSGLLDAASRVILPLPEALQSSIISSPITSAVIQFFGILIIAVLTDKVGRFFGGKGNYEDALKATVWFSFVWLFGVVLILVVLLFFAPIAPLVQLATMIWMIIVFTTFVQVLHQFEKFFATLAGVFGTGLILSFVAVFLMGALGIFEMVGPSDV